MRAVVLALVVASASSAGAQLRPEVRVEFVRAAARNRVEGGLGLGGALGPYLRATVTGSYDLAGDTTGPRRSRVEGQVRFLLDPIAQSRWGLSFAGGLGVRQRVYMMAAAELEGPSIKGLRPAIQFALGAGQRIGFVLRRARDGRR